jgi:diaminohydroxyphosphoribosylaminopyrimidine deaminase/5-amino-6-(5-phosphoribosylamino)uracil reductase
MAVQDPNPKVAGRGVAFLRAHGTEVVVDVDRDRARSLNAYFLTWIAQRRPFVIVKAAVSADGFVGRTDAAVKLTGPAADRYFHRQRAEVDAIAVGSGTVLVDDPALTARGVYRERPLIRILFDRRARIPPNARVFSTLAAGPVIMIVSEAAAAANREPLATLEKQGVVIDRCGDAGLAAALERLGERKILSLLVEGGPTLHQALVDERLVDRVQLVATAKMLTAGVRPASHETLRRDGPERVTHLGDDTLMEFDVHRSD